MEKERVSPGFNELIGRALTDEKFRYLLFEDRKSATEGFRLSQVDLAALDNLTLDQLSEHAERLGARASLTIKVVITKSF